MARYTMETLELIQALAGNQNPAELDDIDAAIEAAIPQIFGNNFPYYNPAGRHDFAVKFLKNYLFHEICTTPWGRWKMMLHARLAEIMPRYELLWHSETASEFQYDPLETVNVHYAGNKHVDEDTDHDHTAEEAATTDDVTQTGTQSGREEITENAEGQQDATNTWGRGRADGQTQAGHEDGSKTTTSSEHDGTNSESGTTNNTRKFSDTPQNNIPVATDGYGNIIMQYLTNITMDNGGHSKKGEEHANDSGEGTAHSMANDQNVSHSGTAQESHGEGSQSRHGMQTGTATETATTDTIHGNDYSQEEQSHDDNVFVHDDKWDEYRQGFEHGHSYQQLVQQWRDLIIEYDKEIMDACRDCFMMIF